jgi:hypothetical protein
MAENGFIENCFDIILDKGCLDCIQTNDLPNAIKEIYHSLNLNGTFYFISTAKPAKRVNILSDTQYRIKLNIEEIGNVSLNLDTSEEDSQLYYEDNIYYLYNVTKII